MVARHDDRRTTMVGHIGEMGGRATSPWCGRQGDGCDRPVVVTKQLVPCLGALRNALCGGLGGSLEAKLATWGKNRARKALRGQAEVLTVERRAPDLRVYRQDGRLERSGAPTKRVSPGADAQSAHEARLTAHESSFLRLKTAVHIPSAPSWRGVSAKRGMLLHHGGAAGDDVTNQPGTLSARVR